MQQQLGIFNGATFDFLWLDSLANFYIIEAAKSL